MASAPTGKPSASGSTPLAGGTRSATMSGGTTRTRAVPTPPGSTGYADLVPDRSGGSSRKVVLAESGRMFEMTAEVCDTATRWAENVAAGARERGRIAREGCMRTVRSRA